MELSVLSTSITEPIDADEVKAYMGYPLSDTSQDTTIESMITTAREWLESRTGLSLVSKSYKAQFTKDDEEEGWYELPMSPVLASPAITCSVTGVSTTFQQKGLKTVWIAPDNVIGTIGVGSTTSIYYVEVVFQAGASNVTANNVLMELVSIAFNNRDGGNQSYARLPYDLRERVNSLIVY